MSLEPPKTNVANQLETIVASIQSNVAANVLVQLQLQLQANLDAVVTVLNVAAGNITDATNAAVIEIGGDVNNLTTAQIAQIKAAIDSAVLAVNNVTATVTASVSVLTPGIKQLVVTEVNAIKAAVNNILTPLTQFVQGLRVNATASAVVTGLGGVLTSLLTSTANILSSLGLSILGISV